MVGRCPLRLGQDQARLEADLAEDRALRLKVEPKPTQAEVELPAITSDEQGPAIPDPVEVESYHRDRRPDDRNDGHNRCGERFRANRRRGQDLRKRASDRRNSGDHRRVSEGRPASVSVADRERFYEAGYRGELRTMVDYVVETEGPIYFDIIVDRLARAHSIQRSGENVHKVVRLALGRDRFVLTKEADREIVWKRDARPEQVVAYRRGGSREHGDVPLCELAGLANALRAKGFEDEEIVRRMQEHFRLGRLAASTRERFEAAVACLP